ncbi:hypothetical protein SLEP1_g4407 [Rubroshorea leprosula]|uniref:Nuclear matrix constituent protein 1-like protein n=1 Tax=Rubroshorea leprosula TaxID=152421 RepID=A0AAV5HNL3_9ROSI|nr:hypothetical protein SLEP1_g4407 [Rubroshorea leprosula]
MFTPQRKPWTPITPRSEAHRAGFSNSRSTIAGKGKAVMFADDPPQLPPPPVNSLNVKGSLKAVADGEDVDDWKRFKEAGLLDEAALERRDREALVEKLSKLEQDLFDYQYNMGLLLIEKKEWTSKCEELKQEVAEAEAIFKREQTAHRIALSEAEKRQENLMNALDVEKKCVLDLEKALRDVQEEQGQVKQSSELKLANANSMVVGIEEKSLEVEKRMCAAEAKIAEVNGKNIELEMKLQELEARESLLQRERSSLATEREAHQAVFYKQREELREWERKLKEGEERLSELRRTLNQREEKSNESDKIMKQTERSIEELQKKIDLSNLELQKRENGVNKRLTDLTLKEKEASALKNTLEAKEKELLALEEKLVARERMEIQSCLDEQRVILDTKMQEFELELEEKGKSLDREFRSKVGEVEQRELEINHSEEKLRKREQALEKKLEKVKEKEKDLEARLKAVKEREKFIKGEEKKQQLEKQQLHNEKEKLQIVKEEIDKIKAENSLKELQICEEREKLKIAIEERSEHIRLQSELKQQIDNYRCQEELLLKECEDLKQERENFEKEWDVLHEKRVEISRLQREFGEEKEKFEKLQLSEEERLRKEESAKQNYISKELEAIRLQKESFEATMKHEKSALSEKAENEHTKMLRDFEHQKMKLETDLQSRFNKMQKDMQERMRAFEEEKERELNSIRQSAEEAEREMEEIRSERSALEREKQEIAINKDMLKDQQLEMSKDIDELHAISSRFKDRRQFVRERNHFLAFVEKLKKCKDCGDIMREFVLSDLHLVDSVDEQLPSLPQMADELFREHQGNIGVSGVTDIKGSPSVGMEYPESAGRMSWLHKCTSKIFNISPSKRDECKGQAPGLLTSKEAGEHGGELQPSLGIPSDSMHNRPVQSDAIREADDGFVQSLDDQSYLDSKEQEGPEDSQQSELRTVRRRPGRKRKSGLNRTRTMKAVVEEAKVIIGPEEPQASESMQPDEENAGTSSHTVKRTRNRASKRPRESELNAADSEERSDAVIAGGHEKRLQGVALVRQTPYNLRRHKTSEAAMPSQASSDQKTREEEADPGVPQGIVTGKRKVTLKTVEISQEMVVGSKPTADIDDNGDAAKSVENVVLSEEVNDTPPQYDNQDENGSTIHEEDDGSDDDVEHPGEVSIGKKIWTFFTT